MKTRKKKTRQEIAIQAGIEADLGAAPGVHLMRNSNGAAKYYDDNGDVSVVPYGLGNGSPDLVFQISVMVVPVNVDHALPRRVAIWLALEVKDPNGVVEPEQLKCHAIWRSFGVIVEVVRSVHDARAVLTRIRKEFGS